MICQIRLPFESQKGLRYSVSASSVMHGMLMEKIPTEYASLLHSLPIRPFSQYVWNSPDSGGGNAGNSGNVWTVNTLTQEAYENIAVPVLSLREAYIKHKKDLIVFGEPEIRYDSCDELLERNSGGTGAVLQFLTPCAFKAAGSYVNIPDIRMMFTGLAKRFDSIYGIEDNDYDALSAELLRCVATPDFRIESTVFQTEGVKIPAFTGYISLRTKGSPEFRSYVSMLCSFAEYSGIGIKTALGMGHVIRKRHGTV
ncbi:MAG: CRISPR system precrRNA processing endoribonuclease RAMP protein Cas6 [Ruminococcus sp.]|nr:CRISPR system precrRNA processing endoribonuclease RAMP protein Cas6 [Ruminococcus sp.]